MAMFENINSSNQPGLEQEIRQAVADAMQHLFSQSGWRTYTGPNQKRLVEVAAELVGTRHAGLACSGSAALELVLRACRFQPGDEVLLSGYDYPGNFTAIENVGLRPALVDLDKDSWCLCPQSLDETYTPQCKALIVSHLHGQLQDLPSLQVWCEARGLWLIQDACQAVGATLGGQPLGCWADATILSFGGSKTLSAGRGGAWCTSSDELAQRLRIAAGVGSGSYEMSEVQAALVLAQVPFLERITVCCRHYFARQAEQWLTRHTGLVVPWQQQLANTAFYQAGFLMVSQELGESHSRESAPLELIGSELGHGFDGFHRRSSRRCRKVGELRNCADIAARTVTLHHRLALAATSPGEPAS